MSACSLSLATMTLVGHCCTVCFFLSSNTWWLGLLLFLLFFEQMILFFCALKNRQLFSSKSGALAFKIQLVGGADFSRQKRLTLWARLRYLKNLDHCIKWTSCTIVHSMLDIDLKKRVIPLRLDLHQALKVKRFCQEKSSPTPLTSTSWSLKYNMPRFW